MQLLSDSPGGLSRMKETGIEFFPSFWAVAQCHGSAAGGKKFKPENAIELESGTALPINCTSIGGSRTLLRSEQKPLCCIVLGLVAWTETPLGWVTERLNWKRNIQRHACRKSSHHSFITNVGFWYLIIILHEF